MKIKDLLERKKNRLREIQEKSKTTEDITELRNLNAEADTLEEEINILSSAVKESYVDDMGMAQRTKAVNSEVPGVVKEAINQRTQSENEKDIEYRSAFKDFVTKGTPIPKEYRNDAITKTTDIGTAIPIVLVDRIIEKIESVGMILQRVTQTAYPAGVNIPTSSVKPVATWVAEGASSDKQKKPTGVITFTHHKLRCEIAITIEASAMSLAAFETSFVNNVSEAMIKAIETAIISLDGTSSPKGILTDTPESGQALTAKTIDYKLLINAEAAIPSAYEGSAVWCMTKKTFMEFVGMTDANGQPIARVNYGVAGKPERYLLGREVVIANGDYMDTYSDTLSAGKVFAFIFDFKDYILNTVYDMGIQKKQDWDTEDYLTKAVMACDGKVVNKQSLVTVAKAAATGTSQTSK